jgi:nucleotidyltransferase/DNA polymerase involved in DNA repair
LDVTYPARKLFGIARGDPWEVVSSKSQGQCYTVHVPLLESSPATASTQHTSNDTKEPNELDKTSNPTSSSNDNQTTFLEEEFARLYKSSPYQQAGWRQAELGKRRDSTEGKASIESYRIASAIIFETVKNWQRSHLQTQKQLQQQDQQQQEKEEEGSNRNFPNVILERASIYEFFVDVTAAVHADFWWDDQPAECQALPPLPPSTVHLGQHHNIKDDGLTDDTVFLIRGSWISHWIRQSIKNRFGFIMSAGISMNKTVAKLTASYGNPDEQVVSFPQHVNVLLDATPIRKCRKLNGKLGRALIDLLPSHVEPTLGNIRRHLALTQLETRLPSELAESALWVYRVAHGQDDEPVQSTSEDDRALVQSITIFKSLKEADGAIKRRREEVEKRESEQEQTTSYRLKEPPSMTKRRAVGKEKDWHQTANVTAQTPLKSCNFLPFHFHMLKSLYEDVYEDTLPMLSVMGDDDTNKGRNLAEPNEAIWASIREFVKQRTKILHVQNQAMESMNVQLAAKNYLESSSHILLSTTTPKSAGTVIDSSPLLRRQHSVSVTSPSIPSPLSGTVYNRTNSIGEVCNSFQLVSILLQKRVTVVQTRYKEGTRPFHSLHDFVKKQANALHSNVKHIEQTIGSMNQSLCQQLTDSPRSPPSTLPTQEMEQHRSTLADAQVKLKLWTLLLQDLDNALLKHSK